MTRLEQAQGVTPPQGNSSNVIVNSNSFTKLKKTTFQAVDGVTLNGWFTPADSDNLIICNHFSTGNRYGFPGHSELWTLKVVNLRSIFCLATKPFMKPASTLSLTTCETIN